MLSLSFLMFLFHGKCLRPRPVCIRMMKKESNTHPQVDGRTDGRGRADNETAAAMSKNAVPTNPHFGLRDFPLHIR